MKKRQKEKLLNYVDRELFIKLAKNTRDFSHEMNWLE